MSAPKTKISVGMISSPPATPRKVLAVLLSGSRRQAAAKGGMAAPADHAPARPSSDGGKSL